MKLLDILLSVILPPASVFKTTGFSFSLVLNLLLTLLGWVPGVIHALWMMSKQSEALAD